MITLPEYTDVIIPRGGKSLSATRNPPKATAPHQTSFIGTAAACTNMPIWKRRCAIRDNAKTRR
jgi:gamma-glutamyl phosphate reductase